MPRFLNFKSILTRPIKRRLVLDLDAVMIQDFDISKYCRDIYNFPKMLGDKGLLLDWKNDQYDYVYYGYPDFDKLILTVLSWPGWGVDFFSAGIHERNVKLVADYLTQKFSGYSNNPSQAYQNLLSVNQLRIFSRQHLKEGRRDLPRDGLERYGQRKKDLRVVQDDISNVVIADDDRSYILGDQYPYIGLSYITSNDFISKIKLNDDKVIFDPNNNAAYIMGIVASCKELLDKRQATSLREALDVTLSHKGKTLIPQYELHGGIHRDYSPWYLDQAHEARREDNSINPAYLEKMNGWITKGKKHFALFPELEFFKEYKERMQLPRKSTKPIKSSASTKFQDMVVQKRLQQPSKKSR